MSSHPRAIVAKLGLVTLAVSLLSGCATPPPPLQPGSAASADAEFYEAQRLFLDGEFSQAAVRFEQYAMRFPGSAHAGEAAYWEGRCHMKLARYERAEKSFRKALEERGSPAQEVRATMGLADACFMQQEYARASRYYREVWAHRNRDGVAPDLVLYRLGQCEQRQGRDQPAAEYFRQLRSLYPSSAYVARTPQEPAPGGSHYVQLGLYTKSRTAEGEAKALRVEKGVAAYVVRDGELYAVRTGSFATIEDAKQEARRLKSLGIDAIAK